MRWLRRLLLIALTLGVLVGGWRFASENQEPVRVHYVAGESVEVPLWQVLVLSFGAGAGLVLLYTVFSSARSGLVKRRYRKEITGLEAEIHQLRNLPLDPTDPASREARLAPESESPGGSAAGVAPEGGASGGSSA